MDLSEYQRIADAQDGHWWYAATRELVEQMFGPRLMPHAAVLDVGAGPGATGSWLAGYGSPVAVDRQPLALALHRERHPATPVVVGDITQLPVADDSVDGVLCVTVLYHRGVASPAAAVAELTRVLRPGGVACLMEPGVRRLRRAHDRITHAGRRFSLGELRSLATGAGLEVERATGAFAFLVPPAAVKAVVERKASASASDVDRAESGLGGVLPAMARAERALLRHVSLPAGLSVLVVARKPED